MTTTKAEGASSPATLPDALEYLRGAGLRATFQDRPIPLGKFGRVMCRLYQRSDDAEVMWAPGEDDFHAVLLAGRRLKLWT